MSENRAPFVIVPPPTAAQEERDPAGMDPAFRAHVAQEAREQGIAPGRLFVVPPPGRRGPPEAPEVRELRLHRERLAADDASNARAEADARTRIANASADELVHALVRTLPPAAARRVAAALSTTDSMETAS